MKIYGSGHIKGRRLESSVWFRNHSKLSLLLQSRTCIKLVTRLPPCHLVLTQIFLLHPGFFWGADHLSTFYQISRTLPDSITSQKLSIRSPSRLELYPAYADSKMNFATIKQAQILQPIYPSWGESLPYLKDKMNIGQLVLKRLTKEKQCKILLLREPNSIYHICYLIFNLPFDTSFSTNFHILFPIFSSLLIMYLSL